MSDLHASPGAAAPASPGRALRSFWAQTFVYSGRATRAEYNWPLALYVVGLVALEIAFSRSAAWSGAIWTLLFIVPWIALISRRCHDTNRRGIFGLWLLVTQLGFIIVSVLLIFGSSDPRGARFDADADVLVSAP